LVNEGRGFLSDGEKSDIKKRVKKQPVSYEGKKKGGHRQERKTSPKDAGRR